MFGDHERPTRVRLEQDRRLARYLRTEVYAYGSAHRRRLDAAGVGRDGVRTASDLARIPALALHEMGDPTALVLRPTEEAIRTLGDRALAGHMVWLRLTGRIAAFDATHVEPLFKPIHWVLDEGVPVGSSAADVDRLAEIGRRWLEAAGLVRRDVIVSVVPPAPTMAFWQLVLGARRAGLSTLCLSPSTAAPDIARLAPTVLAGLPGDLLRLLDGSSAPGVHTVLALGAPLAPAERAELERRLAPGAAVLNAWAPPGVRSLWAECRGRTGLHTWPATEVVQEERGEVVWTALEWRGTVLLRLRTGVAGALVDGRCPSCGRTSARVVPH